MSNVNNLQKGLEAFRLRSWKEAYTHLSSADEINSLAPDDLELLARAAYLCGKESECIETWIRAYKEFQGRRKTKEAAGSAFWTGLILSNLGDFAQSSGWFARARRLVGESREECLEQGLLQIPEALGHLRSGELKKAYDCFERAGQAARKFNNPDLLALSYLGRGQAMIHQDKISEGTKLLDEAMVAVISDEASPIIAGIIYCAVIDTCQKIFDLRRAQEWTEALTRWCRSQTDLIPYRGQCMVRRAEVKQLHGEWEDASTEIEEACKIAGDSTPSATGEALYLQAELYRLQGNFSKAEQTYSQANKQGRSPHPGLACLRLAQGQVDKALKAIRREERERQSSIARSKILPACVDIMLAASEVEAARSASEEIAEIAIKFQSPFLRAIAVRSEGKLLMAEDEDRDALTKLRESWSLFNGIEAVYESARTRVLMGVACQNIGDRDSAKMEFDAAKWTFENLGAKHDLKKVNAFLQDSPSGNTHGLTTRELEILRSLATGKTNKAIAEDLFISERTVDRHVSNILSKLNVPSRAAATAFAYEHDLI